MPGSVEETVRGLLGPALRAKTGFTIKGEVETNPGLIRFIGSQPAARMGDMMMVVEAILHAERRGPEWTVDISKRYFLMGDKLVQAFRFIVRAKPEADSKPTDDPNMINAVAAVAEVIKTTQRARVEIDEVPLGPAATPDRHASRGGRGAGPMNTAVVGPMAAVMARRGM